VNFIESLFHIAPDGGSGLLESAIALAVAVFLVLLYIIRSKALIRHLPSTLKGIMSQPLRGRRCFLGRSAGVVC
jgi:hypothetical protein